MSKLKSPGKPFEISKWEVWEAWKKVKENKGGPGVDGVTIEDFEKDLRNNLYRIWNRMSSGTWFPPPVKAVEIPKQHGGGTRTLGILVSAIEWLKLWWRRTWRKGWTRYFILTHMATARTRPRWMR